MNQVKVELYISSSNEAFDTMPGEEIGRLLREASDYFYLNEFSGDVSEAKKLRCTNGNTVGYFSFEITKKGE